MNGRLFLRLYRVGFALAVVIAIGILVLDLVRLDRFDPLNFFSYFTIQSNLIAVAAFLLAARSGGDRSHGLNLLRGGSVVYMTVTFVVFGLLLEGTNVDTTLAWVDFIVHKLFPIVVLIDWLIDPPRERVTVRQALLWLVYPLIWVAYTLARGALTDRYPYPFLDPTNAGYASVVIYIVAIFVFGLLVMAVVAMLGNWAGRRRAAEAIDGGHA
ncbi:Pr6Pr family membrane protein [soil metagenome]